MNKVMDYDFRDVVIAMCITISYAISGTLAVVSIINNEYLHAIILSGVALVLLKLNGAGAEHVDNARSHYKHSV